MNKSLTSLSLYLSANRMKAIELNNLLTDMTSDTHSKQQYRMDIITWQDGSLDIMDQDAIDCYDSNILSF